jgi:predicted lipoprotein with Yx(FWY)xxD motif
MITNARGWYAGAAVAAGVGVLALVTSCSSSSGNTQPNQAGGGTTVAVRDVSGDQVLVNSSGRTLYTSDQEKAAGKILCSSRDCLAIWTPLTLAKGQQPTGPSGVSLSTVSRPDGSTQVEFNGGPLYTFSFDHAAGDAKGENTKDSFAGTAFTWHSATTSGVVAPNSGQSNPGYGY